jgi:hypothetical protein
MVDEMVKWGLVHLQSLFADLGKFVCSFTIIVCST